jgi:hypothetical protein
MTKKQNRYRHLSFRAEFDGDPELRRAPENMPLNRAARRLKAKTRKAGQKRRGA